MIQKNKVMNVMICCCLLLIIILTNVRAQVINSTSGKSHRNLYNDVLKRFTYILGKSGFKIDTIYLNQNPQAYNIDDIEDRIGGIDFETPGWSTDLTRYDNIKELSGKFKRNFLNITIFPLNFAKSQFYLYLNIDVIERKYANKKYEFENGVIFYYNYDSRKKSFIYSHYSYPKIELGKQEADSAPTYKQ